MEKSSRGTREPRIVNPAAAEIDVGSQIHYVAIPDGKDGRLVKSFGCVTAELMRMAE